MSKRNDEAEDPRRAFLLRMLAAGVLGAGGISGAAAQVLRPPPAEAACRAVGL